MISTTARQFLIVALHLSLAQFLLPTSTLADTPEDVWGYTVSLLPGQTFPSLPDAEGALKSSDVDEDAPYLQRVDDDLTVSQTIVIDYAILPEEAAPGPWTYQSASGGPLFADEGGVYSYILEPYQDSLCAFSLTATGGWVSIASQGEYSIEETKSYELNVESATYDSNEQEWVCTGITTTSTTGMRRYRALLCPDEPPYGGACVNNLTATITGRLIPANVAEEDGIDECVGNPCNPGTGNKSEAETDYNNGELVFRRTYNSLVQTKSNPLLGVGWTHNFASGLIAPDTPGWPYAWIRGDGQVEHLGYRGPELYTSKSGTGVQLRLSGSEWIIHKPSGAREGYASGNLIWKEDASGQRTTLTYDLEGRLSMITGPFGHTLQLIYPSPGSNLASITDPAGQTINYSYGSNDNLTQVTYPDGTTRTYHYEDLNLPNNLTGITDENGDRYSTFAYDSWGRATLTEHAGGFERYTLQYNADASTTVTDAAGVTSTYEYTGLYYGVRKLSKLTSSGSSKTRTYEYWTRNGGQRRLASSTDDNGVRTSYTYSNYHKTSMTSAWGKPQTRITNYEYLADEHELPTRVTTPSVSGGANLREVLIAYNTDQLPTQITTSGFTPGGQAVTRSTGLSYSASGQVTQIDGPRTDVTDTTDFEYHVCTTGAQCGQLKKVTNALGHVTTYDAYDGHGRALQITDPNGLKTAYTYDQRGRVLTVTQTPPAGAARVTTYTYDNARQLKTVSTPGGVTLIYAYNAAHLLTSITDNLGNKIQYGYNLKGNRTDEDVYDPGNVLVRTLDTAYDVRDRVSQINAAGSITDLVFDAVGNLTSEEDPLDAATTHTYDPLNRLIKTVDALAGITDYSYDVNDNLVQVKAPNGATTTYSYDDLGNLPQEVSPDRGTTTYAYDVAGNRVSQTDAKNQTTTYQYDAINRLTQANYDDGQVVTYVYDVVAAEKGRLGRITDPSGQTEWDYDVFGAVTQKRQTIGTVTLTTSYTYDSAGRVATMTYPSGKVIGYGYADGQPTSMTVDGQTLLSNITYESFGPVSGWTWGNGTAHNRDFDLRGQLTSHSLGTDTRTLTYDLAGRITDIVDAANDMDYGYDALGRLTSFTSTGNPSLPLSQTFTYDANGNRLTFSENGGTAETYSYLANSNRLQSVSGPVSKTYTYDANGNVTDDGVHTYTYNGRNRLVSVDQGTIKYNHNGVGERVFKDATIDKLFAYDEFGQLIGEFDLGGEPDQETVFLASVPVALLDGTATYYIHADHSSTPRAFSDGNTIVWRWDSDPFGASLPDEDPDGDSNTIEHNGRFPGQYYEHETGLHYNYFRDYDPTHGRYLKHDPIGLGGGTNTYLYANADPIRYIDSEGLQTEGALYSCVVGGPANPVCDAALIVNACKWAIAGGFAWWALRSDSECNGDGDCEDGEEEEGEPAPEDLVKGIGKISEKTGLPAREVRDRIHKAKQNIPKGTGIRNPDVVVNPITGEIYPETPDGGIGDSIGNIFDEPGGFR